MSLPDARPHPQEADAAARSVRGFPTTLSFDDAERLQALCGPLRHSWEYVNNKGQRRCTKCGLPSTRQNQTTGCEGDEDRRFLLAVAAQLEGHIRDLQRKVESHDAR